MQVVNFMCALYFFVQLGQTPLMFHYCKCIDVNRKPLGINSTTGHTGMKGELCRGIYMFTVEYYSFVHEYD